MLADGCLSELEIWGATHVLPGPPLLPAPVRQHPIRLGDGRSIRLDAAWPELRVAVELDGAAFHGSRQARERDLRRDTALAREVRREAPAQIRHEAVALLRLVDG